MSVASLAYYLPTAIMIIGIVVAVGIGGAFFFRPSGGKNASWIYGTLLIMAGLTQLHFWMDFAGVFHRHPGWRYLPFYYSLWLPVLLFFYAKVSLYPEYRLRWTDGKHLAFPLAQLLYFLITALVPEWRSEVGRQFYNPFYGGLEQAIFLIFWPLYILFAYQYLRSRRRQMKYWSLPRVVYYVRKLLKGCAIFFTAYAFLSMVDFLSFKYLAIDLRSSVWYEGFQALAFTVLLYWLIAYGFQVLLWGQKLLLRD